MQKYRLVIFVVTYILTIFFGHHVFCDVIPDSFTFVEENVPSATIVIGSKIDNEDNLHFAAILAEAVKEISGVAIDISGKSGKIKTNGHILIGMLKDLPLAETLLKEDGLFNTQDDVEERGYVYHPLQEDLGEQGFVIHKTERENKEYLIVAGYTGVGTLYAVNTVVDRLHMEGKQLIVDGLGTRLLPIINVPAFKYRSLQTAVGGPDYLGPDQYMKEFGYDYKGFVDWLASHKINNILLHDTCFSWGLFYESERFPEMVNRDSPNLKVDYIGGIIKYGRKRGITVFFSQNFPDRADCIVKAYPEFAGTNEKFPNTVCYNKPGLIELWKDYWNDILDHYPDVEAVGVQFTEILRYRCQCEFCQSDKSFDKSLEYFNEMVKICRSKNPPIKCWIWTTPGVREILKHRNEYPELTVIDWTLTHKHFMFKYYIPRGDWYLFHKMAKHTEFGMKYMCMAQNRFGTEGLQIRSIKFKENDRKYQFFEEFTWNPDLSIDDYAYLYTIKMLRRKNEDVSKAYAHYIRARGYITIFAKENWREYGNLTNTWIEFENYHEKLEKEMNALECTLETITIDSDFVDWLKTRPAELTELIEKTELINWKKSKFIRVIKKKDF